MNAFIRSASYRCFVKHEITEAQLAAIIRWAADFTPASE